MEKVSYEIATQTVNDWLDHKKIKSNRRESLKTFIEILVDAVAEGQLVLQEDFKFSYELSFPIGEGGNITHIDFVPRINDAKLEPYKRGIKGADAFETSNLVMLCGLTQKPVNVIRALDTVDKQVADAIAIFFL